MNAFFAAALSSVWLESLGHIALKGAALLTLALLAGAALRPVSAARRYVLWFSSLLALCVVTITAPLLPAWRVLPSQEMPMLEVPVPQEEPAMVEEEPLSVATHAAPQPPVVAPEHATNPTPTPTLQWPTISWNDVVTGLPMVWLVIATGLGACLVISSVRLTRLRRRCSKVEMPARLRAALSELTATSGKTAPELIIGPAGSIPMVWGIIQPCLMLPADALEWHEEKLRVVLLHELAHLQRRDPAALLVAQIAQALHWFNPLVWLTVRCLRADQEHACDDAVLRHGVRSSDYAQHLLDLSQSRRLAPGLGLCALAMARSAPVESRLAAILDPRIKRDASSRTVAFCALVIAASIAAPLAMLANETAKGLRGRLLDRHGVVLAESTKEKVREYPLKTLAAHVIGYTGKSGPSDPTPEGRAAMEKQQNAELKQGKDVALSLDARIQALTIQAVKNSGFERAAVVVLDPRTGEILASVSLPSYDPNRFIPTLAKEDWEVYVKDKSVPLFDRCLRGQYVPGSAFVPFTALAGIAAGVGEKQFDCTGSVEYGGRIYQCWIGRQKSTGHGTLDMKSAIVASCNCYWYQFGNAAGVDAFARLGRLIGIGEATGVTVDEGKGELPGPETLAAKDGALGKWTAGHTANLAIGQGTLLTTPLQLAVLAATVGNGGKVPKTTLLRLESDANPEWRADLIAEGLTANQIEQIREGMRLVVNSDNGSGKAARSDKVVIAGKTGTSQFWRSVNGKQEQDNRALFVGFAPFDQPTLAFAVLVEGGKSGGADAAPIAKRIVEESLALPANGSGKVEPVEEPDGERKAAFDATGDDLKREIQKAAPDSKTGLTLDEITVRNGRVMISGIASSMMQALKFREKLAEIGKDREIEWSFPVPETMEDKQRVRFKATGTMTWESTKTAARNPDDSLRGTAQLTQNSTPTQMPSDQIFEEGSDRFNDRAELTLMKLGLLIEKNPGTQFVITCYTDSVGDDQTNLELSQRRADVVATWLRENLHLTTQRIKAVGMGEKDLIETNAGADKEARRVNQRLEIKIASAGVDQKAAAHSNASTPGEGTTGANSPWQVNKQGGRDYVTLENVKSFYHFDSLSRNGTAVELKTRSVAIKAEVGSRELHVNGVKFLSSDPVVEVEGNPSVSQLDLARLIDPILRPNYIKSAVAFDTVVIDPGHGGHDEGAKGVYDVEKDMTLKLGVNLRAALEERGFKVVMTRTADEFKSLVDRVWRANHTPDSIVISLHFNSGDKEASGVETQALTAEAGTDPALNSQNIALATAIHTNVVTQLKLADRGVKRAQWTILKSCERPGILFEGGFITNDSDGRLIASETYRKALAVTMADGVVNYRKAIQATRPTKANDPEDGQASTEPQTEEQAAADMLRRVEAKQYVFTKTRLDEVFHLLAADAGISFLSLREGAPELSRVITVKIHASPFSVLETLSRANDLRLMFDGGNWYLRPAEPVDPELVGKSYALPRTKAASDIVINDLRAILKSPATSTERSPATPDTPVKAGESLMAEPKVIWKQEENSIYVVGTRLQHSRVKAYFEGLTQGAEKPAVAPKDDPKPAKNPNDSSASIDRQPVGLNRALKSSGAVVFGKSWQNTLGMKMVPLGQAMIAGTETRRQDFAEFAKAANLPPVPGRILNKDTPLPVTFVSRQEAEAFCQWLTESERSKGLLQRSVKHSLPSDDAWSMAANLPRERGDSPSARNLRVRAIYPWGLEWPPPSRAGNFVARKQGLAPVMSFLPDRRGIFDLSGNVWEWIADSWGSDDETTRSYGVVRGGAYSTGESTELLASYRRPLTVNSRLPDVGFRVVLVEDDKLARN